MTKKYENAYALLKKHWVKIAYIAPVIISFCVGVYYRTNSGLSYSSVQVLWPQNAYQSPEEPLNYNPEDAVTLHLTPNYLGRFWEEFPPYYFKGEGNFKNFSRRKIGQGTNNQVELKVIFQNSPKGDPLLLSTIQAKVKQTKVDSFPWEKISSIKPIFKTENRNLTLKVTNTGIGPALNFSVEPEVTNSNVIVAPSVDAHAILHNEDNAYVRFAFRDTSNTIINNEDVTFVEVDSNGGLFSEGYNFTVYRHLPDSIEFDSLAVDLVCIDPLSENGKSKRYEEIKTVEELKNHTTVWGTQKVGIKYHYSLLNNSEITTQQHDQILLKNSVGFLYKESFSYHQPCGRSASGSGGDIGRGMISQGFSMLPGTPESKFPEGENMHITRFSFTSHELDDSQYISKTKNSDAILNAGGYLITYITLNNVHNGEYTIEMQVNGRDIKTVTIETLTPDEYSFKFPESIKYFEFNPDKIGNSSMEYTNDIDTQNGDVSIAE